ncbi:MAG: ATP-grasp domain-containing protein [Myxococcota bacterium]
MVDARTTRNRTLLLLGAGFEQIEALCVARELGYRTVAFDNDEGAAGRAHADAFERVDLKDPDALLYAAERARPDGVFVHAAELAVECARVAETLDLPGIGVESALDATDKSRRIVRLGQAGIRTPRHVVLDADERDPRAWLDATRSIAFPKILKPTNQAGARGVELVSDEAALTAYHGRRAAFGCERFVCEERLRGLELSTESIAIAGKPVHHAIARRHYDTTAHLHPHFIEDGHSMPHALPLALRAEIESVIERCFGALGIATGVLKGDLLVDADGTVHVLEMAARTSGGRFADTVVPLSSGVHILYPLIALAMGDAPRPDDLTPCREAGVSQRFFLHDGPARVRRWPALRRLVARPGVAHVKLDEAKLAGGLLPRIRSHRDRLGYVICTGPTRDEADRLALEITGAFARALALEPATEPAAEAER